MSVNIANPPVSIPPQAEAALRSLLATLKATPPTAAVWNLQQIAEARPRVLGRFSPAFSPSNIGHLSRGTVLEFLRFENNLHWRGLERTGKPLTSDMQRLRGALAILLDEGRPIVERLARLRPPGGKGMVPYLGPAVITAILHVAYPDRYGVVNNLLKPAMSRIGIWPKHVSPDSLPDLFQAVNPIFLDLASRLEIDLWTLDYLWWYLAVDAGVPAGQDGPGPRPEGPSAIVASAGIPPKSDGIQGAASGFKIPSGLSFSMAGAEARLLRFCREEYVYYDAIADRVPMCVDPIDVLATVSVNSFVNKATLVRSVHRGIASRCDAILPKIPVVADLLTDDPQLDQFRELIHAAVQATGVLVPVATKVLHRKRRHFIPMIDSVLIRHYAAAMTRTDWIENSQIKAKAADVAVEVARAFREDLRTAMPHLSVIRYRLAQAGFDLGPVRILEILLWTQVEPMGYYRAE